jgi:DNA modification methylase
MQKKSNKKGQFKLDLETGNIVPPEKKPKKPVDPRNKLNDLTGAEWIQFTKSWFIEDGKSYEITKDIELHPASFPPSMIKSFINFFTKKDQWVLDPFLGTGSTLVACDETGRNGVGIELYPKYYQTAKKRTNQRIELGSCIKIVEQLKEENLKFNLCITSPPYWNILKKDKDYNQKKREELGLDLKYGDDENDFGLIDNYENFIDELVNLFVKISEIIHENGHIIIVIQNIRELSRVIPAAFDLTRKLGEKIPFQGEKIWLQNQKTLRPYGYPYAFVPNVHHHYCLIFKVKKD